MTFIKPSMIAIMGVSFFMATFATANDAPASFDTLDQDSNGAINFSEFVIDAERRDQDLTTALRQFNVISNGEQTFTQEQYSVAFALQGEIRAKGSDKVVIMPVKSEKVLGAVATGIIIDEVSIQSESEVEVDTDLSVNPSSERQAKEDNGDEISSTSSEADINEANL